MHYGLLPGIHWTSGQQFRLCQHLHHLLLCGHGGLPLPQSHTFPQHLGQQCQHREKESFLGDSLRHQFHCRSGAQPPGIKWALQSIFQHQSPNYCACREHSSYFPPCAFCGRPADYPAGHNENPASVKFLESYRILPVCGGTWSCYCTGFLLWL